MRWILSTAIWLACTAAACGLDHVTLRRGGKQTRISGQLVVKAEDGGLLLLSRDGELWSIQPDEVVAHGVDDEAFVAQTSEEAGSAMLSRLPQGFEVYSTAHYVICHNTSKAYAQWCGALYERLHSGFINYWTHRGIKLHEPTLPLVCVVFSDQKVYSDFSRGELGDATDNIIAYYSLRTNRITMFDLTGLEPLRRAGDRRGTTAQINQMLARPEAERMVATVIHEATHQIAFNCGLHTRFADVPLWVSEGVAMYFEAPDLSNSKGWKTIGEVNYPRLQKLREFTTKRQAGSLNTLIADDKRLRNPRTATEAYAEAWALNYFLIRQKPKEYVAYLQLLSKKEPLIWDEPAERLKEFKAAFGELDKLDADFLRLMQRLR